MSLLEMIDKLSIRNICTFLVLFAINICFLLDYFQTVKNLLRSRRELVHVEALLMQSQNQYDSCIAVTKICMEQVTKCR